MTTKLGTEGAVSLPNEASGMSRDYAPDIVLIMGIRMKGVKGIQSEKKRQLIY